MDPALQELIREGQPDDEVALVVRLKPGGTVPAGVRVVASFGEVVTARVPRSRIGRLHADPAVASVKAPRTYSAELMEVLADEAIELLPSDQRRPDNLAETGKGVRLAVLDWGCDFTHPDLRLTDGSTRICALWDQRGIGTNRYGYGTIHDRAAIDTALRAADPFAALGYRFAASPQHGTHVLGIAAGNGNAGGPVGIAPDAEIIFCHLGASDRDLGNSIELLEALDFAVRQAGDLPLVVNLSVGRIAGPHDASLLIERAIDWVLSNRAGTAIAQSAGNYFDSRCHMSGRLHETMTVDLPIEVRRRSSDKVVVETWYPGPDTFSVSLRGPDMIAAGAERGHKAPLRNNAGARVGTLYHRAFDPNNGDHLIELVLDDAAPIGDWTLTLTGVDVVDGRWHSWIERDTANPKAQARFAAHAATRQSCTGSIANALRTIAVGAHDAADPDFALGAFSSVGPTRDGRVKPLLTAPGVRILSCRSQSAKQTDASYVRMSGTSMAAPHLAGTLALMLQAAGRQPIAAIRRSLFATLAHADADDPRQGYGRLAIADAVARARSLRRPTPHEAADRAQRLSPAEQRTLIAEPSEGTPAMSETTLSHPWIADREHGRYILGRALDPGDEEMRLIGWQGRRLGENLQRGDAIIDTGGQLIALIDGPQLFSHGSARAAGLVTEGPWPGRYVRLLSPEGQTSPFVQRIAGPDGLVLDGLAVVRPQPSENAPDFAAAEALVEAAENETRPTLRRGSRGDAVVEAQTKLNRASARFGETGPGLENCPLNVDGVYGRLTRGAVLAFQRRVFPDQQSEWDGVIGPHTWAMLDRFGSGAVRPPVPVPPVPPIPPVPPSPSHLSLEARLRAILDASLLLASNPAATFTPAALPAMPMTGADWAFSLALAGDTVTASGTTCKIDHGGGHVMPMPVTERIRWHDVSVDLAGRSVRLPLNASFLLGSFSASSGGISASHPVWRLASTLDIGCTLVFAFDLSNPASPAPLTDPDRLVRLPAAADFSPWALVVCELVCNRPRADFEPAGVAEIARIYPLIEVLANFASATTTGAVEMVRPRTSPMDHNWANGGNHLVGLYTDRNLSLGMAEALAAWATGTPGRVVPTWDNLFDYFDRDGARASQRLAVVDRRRSRTRADASHRQQIDRISEAMLPSMVEKVPGQGDFDNVHIAPPMSVGPITLGMFGVGATMPATAVSMAPVCAHDCFHMHWRWSRHFVGSGQLGWGPGGPNSAAGAPMVPLNQSVELVIAGGIPGFDYRAVASAQPANDWAVIMHHGAGYAVRFIHAPGAILDGLLTRMAIPAPVRSLIMTWIGGATDKMWSWIYFFLQRWPQLQASPRLLPLEVIAFDLPALRAL